MSLMFLNSLFLYGIAAAAIPVIIHLLSRKTSQRMDFGSVSMLRDIVASRSRSVKLKNLLLLLLRVALLVLAALILSGPVLKTTSGGLLLKGSASANVAIFDLSMSMGIRQNGETLLDQARTRFGALLKTMSGQDSLTVIGARATPEILAGPYTSDFVEAQRVVAGLEPGYGTAALKESVDAAVQLLKTSSCNLRRIFIFSDLHRRSWDFRYQLDAKTSAFTFKPALEYADNLGLLDVSMYTEMVDADEPLSLKVRLVSSPLKSMTRGQLQLRIDQSAVEERILVPAAQSQTVEPFNVPLSPDRMAVTGSFQLGEDALPGDNVRYFNILFPKHIRVLIVSGEGEAVLDKKDSDSFYLREALQPLTDAEHDQHAERAIIRYSEIDVSKTAQAAWSDYDVVVFTALPALDRDAFLRLVEFVKNGGGVALFLGDRTDADFINRHCTADSVEGYKIFSHHVDECVTVPEAEELSWGSWDKNHPLFESFDKYFDPYSVAFTKYWKLTTPAGATDRVLASYTNQDPMIVESPFGNGRWLMVTFSPVRGWTNLPVLPTFLTLTHRIVLYLSGYLLWSPDEYKVGETLFLRNRTLPKTFTSLAVTGPDGVTKNDITFKRDAAGLSADYMFTKPGIYRIETGPPDSQTITAAVNFDPDEIRDLSFFDSQDIVPRWNGGITVFDSQSTDFEGRIRMAVQGTHLRRLLALLCLLVLALEVLLSNRHRYIRT